MRNLRPDREAREGLLLALPGVSPYRETWTLQRRLLAARQAGAVPDVLLLLEHEPVVTVGRSGERGHLLVPRALLAARSVEVCDVERGGSVTYHGPGQLVAYPIVDLRVLDEDVVRFMRLLEESIIRALADFGVGGERLRGYPGVWVNGAKIAAVGVAVKRRVTMHGMALNVDLDLTPFSWINPCGLGRPVTTLSREARRTIALSEVRDAYARRFEEVFGVRLLPADPRDLEARLSAGTDLGGGRAAAVPAG